MTASSTATDAPVLVLFRTDLRVADNRALMAASSTGKPVLPLFVFDQESDGTRPLGGARRWWLHHSLAALGKQLARLGAPLLLSRGRMEVVVDRLISETGADMVLWNRRYDPTEIAVDSRLKASLRERNIRAESFDGHLLHEPSLLKTGSGGSYKVYSPFWRALVTQGEPRDPLDAPRKLRGGKVPASDELDDWALLPTTPDWAHGLRAQWTPGEAGAQDSLAAFVSGALDGYGQGRDMPGVAGTSRLSPHLAHGEITPFQILAALKPASVDAPSGDIEKFRKEVGWREFSYHLLFQNPSLAQVNFNRDFDAFPWAGNRELLSAWQRGLTGYPIVDAGMRELWQTGWMHNRVRMVAASFLIKHLLIDWREGEKWFWDTLVDADPASNPASWQWVAGSGADAAPYFRIFNPILQGEKFDPEGAYVRRYVPELAKLPAKYIHRPWDAPKDILSTAGVKLGADYPVPVIDHSLARERALGAYKSM